jgi:ABC-type glycerol-3-phosphate transport system substrate-binding protein
MVKVKTAFTVLLMVFLLGIAACSNDDGEEGGTTGTSAKEGSEPILIKTHVAPQNARDETFGEVLSGSTIGNAAFCTGGSFIDGPKKPPLDSVDRIFRCSDGNLTITFTTTGSGQEQRGDWKVVKGFGRLEGLAGGGQMSAVFESGRGEGRETLTGTVTR